MPVTRFKKLRDIFPPDDALSNLIFRLTVVREDLAMEALLIFEESIPSADRKDVNLRRGYAMRRHFLSIHTAMDIFREEGTLIQRLIAQPTNELEETIGKHLEKVRKVLNKHWDRLAELRNDVGGHIDKEYSSRILKTMGHMEGAIVLEPDPKLASPANHHWRLPYAVFNMGILPEGFDLNDEEAGSEYFAAHGKLMHDLFRTLLPALDNLIRFQIRRMRAWK
jgi:hypothetical protein